MSERTRPLRRDVVLSPFGGDARAILDAALRAEDEGWDGVWIFDHISSLASPTAPGVGASRDAFALLGAVAARTERVRIGTLVANIHNRHPAQLALAIDTLQGLAPGRVVCGLGSGSGPASPFAGEDRALQRHAQPAAVRRALLGEYLASLRAIWDGGDGVGSFTTVGLTGVVVHPAPRIVVGGGAEAMVTLAAHTADGVNINSGLGPHLADQVATAREIGDARGLADGFEVSVFVSAGPDGFDDSEIPDGVDRVTVLVRP